MGSEMCIRDRIRGELFITNDDFILANEEREALGKKKYASPRHATAGVVQSGKSSVKVRPTIYDIVPKDTEGYDLLTIMEGISDYMKIPHVPTVMARDEEVVEVVEEMAESLLKGKYEPIPFDGVVITTMHYDDRALREGTWRKPGYKLAFKLPSARVVSTIDDIILDITKDGMFVPKACFPKVKLGSLIVSELTTYNSAIMDKNRYYPGREVCLELTGDTVATLKPYIDAGPVEDYHIEKCTHCGGEVKMIGDYLYCAKEKACPGARLAALERYFGRDGVNANGVGREALKTLMGIYGHRPSDIIGGAQASPEAIFALANGEKIYDSLIKSLEATTGRILYGLSIPGIGKETLSKVKDFDDFIMSAPEEIKKEITSLHLCGANVSPN